MNAAVVLESEDFMTEFLYLFTSSAHDVALKWQITLDRICICTENPDNPVNANARVDRLNFLCHGSMIIDVPSKLFIGCSG